MCGELVLDALESLAESVGDRLVRREEWEPARADDLQPEPDQRRVHWRLSTIRSSAAPAGSLPPILADAFALLPDHQVGVGKRHAAANLVRLQHPERAVLDVDDRTLAMPCPSWPVRVFMGSSAAVGRAVQ
jgi:hypothetical protein